MNKDKPTKENQEAFDKGWKGYFNGIGLEGNPHKVLSDLFICWEAGYNAACAIQHADDGGDSDLEPA